MNRVEGDTDRRRRGTTGAQPATVTASRVNTGRMIVVTRHEITSWRGVTMSTVINPAAVIVGIVITRIGTAITETDTMKNVISKKGNHGK